MDGAAAPKSSSPEGRITTPVPSRALPVPGRPPDGGPEGEGRRRGLRGGLERLADLGCAPGDDDEVRFRKRTLAIAALVVTLIAPVWGATYALLGILPAAIIPLAYSIVSMLAIARFARTKRAEEFRTIELGLVLVLPFAEQLALGGFVNGSAVMVWSFAAVLGALLFLPGLGPVRWFATYLALAVATVLLDPLVAPSARPLPEPVRIAFVVLNVGGVSATTFLLLLYFVRQREEALALSDRLLLDVLPAPIAARLKRAPGVIADAYEEATVLFADIVDFTPFAERTSPDAVVALLDRAFRAFDELTERHGLQKIKTIGDAYLVVGGLPERRPDHAEAIAEMALAMQPALEAALPADAPRLRVRIGIDCGPVVAGVIGRRTFSYDLWGDTVNTASRMESQGVPGRIQLTERAAARLAARYRLEERGIVEVRGKGPMRTYFLVGRR